jgi:hypothetical protein
MGAGASEMHIGVYGVLQASHGAVDLSSGFIELHGYQIGMASNRT